MSGIVAGIIYESFSSDSQKNRLILLRRYDDNRFFSLPKPAQAGSTCQESVIPVSYFRELCYFHPNSRRTSILVLRSI